MKDNRYLYLGGISKPSNLFKETNFLEQNKITLQRIEIRQLEQLKTNKEIRQLAIKVEAKQDED